jgi:hypothetical protein
MAAEPLLLNVEKAEFTKLFNDADRGDEAARDAIMHMWSDHADKEILCFICNSTECHPVHMQLLPERDPKSTQLLCAAICIECRKLPIMLRQSRSLRILKRMWGVKAFYFNATTRGSHPTR